MSNSFDVVVMGAGPAGSAAAYYLADAGVRDALVDQSRFPRDKACGDMLGPTAVDELYRLGCGEFLSQFHPDPIWPYVIDIAGEEIPFKVPTGGGTDRIRQMTLPRLELDAGLVRHAENAGVALFEGIQVTETEVEDKQVIVRTSDAECPHLSGKLLIVATGSSSRFTSGKSEGFAVRGYFRGEFESRVAIVWEESLVPGYEWLWPVPGEKVYNIGVGTTWQRARELGILDRLRKSKLIGHGEQVGRSKGGMLNVSYAMSQARVIADRTMWIGDAAGLILPHLGEGIGPALVSARAAAEVALARLEHDMLQEADLKLYADRLDAHFAKPMERSRHLVEATRYPNVLKLMLLISMGAVDSSVFESLIV